MKYYAQLSIILFLVISFECYSQSNIYISADAKINTFPGAQISIFGNIINDSKGGFNHQNGGDVYLFRHSENSIGNTIISDGPNSLKSIDNYNSNGSFCRFWNLFTDVTVGEAIPSGTIVNINSGSGNIQIGQEVRVSNIHHLVNGMIWTPRDDWQHSYIHYDTDSSKCIGMNDLKHIDGYAAKSGKSDFVFPVGDGKIMRSCGIISPENGIFKAAYFNQNSFNGTSGISGVNVNSNNSNNLKERVAKICTTEFWDIDGTGSTKIMLSSENFYSGYSDWKNNFKNYDTNTIIISGYDGEWKNLGIYDSMKLNLGTNNNYSTVKKCVPDTLYSLFTWAVMDSIKFTDIHINNENIIQKSINFTNSGTKQINYTFGNIGNSSIRIYDLIGNLVESENTSYMNGLNTYILKNQFLVNGLYFIIISNDKNEILKSNFIN
jgi:hypothetical protein